jgi:hypothetical protein
VGKNNEDGAMANLIKFCFEFQQSLPNATPNFIGASNWVNYF